MERKKKFDKLALYASTLGIEIALSIGIGLYAGYWLDKKYGTEPWLMLLFFFFGIGAAIKAVIRFIKQVEEKDNEN